MTKLNKPQSGPSSRGDTDATTLAPSSAATHAGSQQPADREPPGVRLPDRRKLDLMAPNSNAQRSAGCLTHVGWSGVVAALESEAGSAYILAPDLSILHVNTAWHTFARANGAPGLAEGWRSLGSVVSDLTPALQQFFAARLSGAFSRSSGWSHVYECSSPEVYRRFHMRARAGPASEALVVVHSLVVESRLSSHLSPGVVGQFTDERGLIVRCAACGRTKRPGEPEVWEWVPSLDAEANISTGICAVCSVHEYGFELDDA